MTLYPILVQNDPPTSFRSATFDTRPNRTGLLVEELQRKLDLCLTVHHQCR